MPNLLRSRSGNVWCVPSKLGRTKQLKRRLYLSESCCLNVSGVRPSQSTKPCRISSILAFAICMACPSLTLMVLVSPVTLSVTSLLLLMSDRCRQKERRIGLKILRDKNSPENHKYQFSGLYIVSLTFY